MEANIPFLYDGDPVAQVSWPNCPTFGLHILMLAEPGMLTTHWLLTVIFS